jgi:lipopolysaccharide export LptBFGC system permease protein LptF
MIESASFVTGRTGLRDIYLAPLGRHTRYMLACYLRHIFIMAAILLAIALTIDLWPQFHLVAKGHGLGAVFSVVRFAMLRTPGLVAPFFPFATYLGVVWTEVVHSQSGERMLVWNSGRSPIECLIPVVLLSVMLGAFEFVTDAYLGPAAMAVQMRERFGLDGQRLDRTRTGDNHWIALPNGLLSTEIRYEPPSILRHLTFYKRDAGGHVVEVDMAPVADRLPGTNVWVMRGGRYWTPELAENDANSDIAIGIAGTETMIPFVKRTVSLSLNPVWLGVYGIETQYLPLPVLRTLARIDAPPMPKGLYRTRLNVLYGEALLPGAMALLAASLSMLFLSYKPPAASIVNIVFAGYLAHFGTKACLLMGQNDYMPPVLAGWLVTGALCTATIAVLRVGGRQSRTTQR